VLENGPGAGWDLAYQTQSNAHDPGANDLGANGEKLPAYLWTEEPVPFLQDIELHRLLRKHCTGIILDAGCGDGRNALHLERHGFHVVGIDVSSAAVEIAADRALQAGQNRAMFFQDDIRNLRTRGPVDGVICIDALSQVEEPKKCLDEFRRVLRPGGLLVFNLYTPEDDTYGSGRQISVRTFEYKNTLFRYYLEDEVAGLMDGWNNIRIRTAVWMEPPHGEFRPSPHTHVSWVVMAEKPE
jgi:SAM-dependent methyltransferase